MMSRLLALPLAPIAILLVATSAFGVPSPSAAPPEAVQRAVTHDPSPPASLAIGLEALQKNARGGVATLRLEVNAVMGLEQAVVSAKVPKGLVFADGSAERTWNVDLAAPGTR